MIVVFGSINADLIFRLERTPVPGQTLLADSLTMQPGGKGANQAVAAARDGARVRIAGAVGPELLGPDTILLLQMESPRAEIEALIARARLAGCRIVLNLAPALPIARHALEQLDLLVVNEDEAAFLGREVGTGPEAAALHAALGAGVIRTMGAAGAEAATGTGSIRVPAPAIAAVDTTAAGDCFVGVLAAALDRGLALPQAIRRAVTAASLACLREGSQRSLPYRAETDAAGHPEAA